MRYRTLSFLLKVSLLLMEWNLDSMHISNSASLFSLASIVCAQCNHAAETILILINILNPWFSLFTFTTLAIILGICLKVQSFQWCSHNYPRLEGWTLWIPIGSLHFAKWQWHFIHSCGSWNTFRSLSLYLFWALALVSEFICNGRCIIMVLRIIKSLRIKRLSLVDLQCSQ